MQIILASSLANWGVDRNPIADGYLVSTNEVIANPYQRSRRRVVGQKAVYNKISSTF